MLCSVCLGRDTIDICTTHPLYVYYNDKLTDGDAVDSLALFDWDHLEELLVPSLDLEDFDPYAANFDPYAAIMRSSQVFKYCG